jgi:uncharacterized protein YukE
VPGSIRVVAEDLKLAAAQVDVHADNLRLTHGTADAQIEAAQSGLPAGAAASLGGAVAKWQRESTVHFTRMVGHSTGLRSGAAAYDETDAQSADDLNAAANAVPPPNLGL